MTEQPDEQRAVRLENDLLEACELIREHWSALLTPTKGRATGSPSRALLTATEQRILLRQRVDQALARWCRIIIRDRALTARLPLDTDTLGMLALVERHARWFSTEHTDAARAARQLGRLADDVHYTAEPPVRDHVHLGPCPFTLPDPADDTKLWFCGGRILTRIGGDGSAHCTGCGQEAVREWWEQVLGLTLPLVSLPSLIPVLHSRLGLRVSERTLRNWRRDRIISPWLRPEDHEPTPRAPLTVGIGPTLAWDLYDPLDVIEDIAGMGRVCALCGHPWDGGGDICTRCWLATARATPTLVEEPIGPTIAGIPVTLRPRILRPERVVDPHDTDSPTRCHFSDLPVDQCACGRTHERTSA